MNTKHYGTVSWAPNKQATYVRVSVPTYGGVPLSVKATFNGFSRRWFTKDTPVEVERTDPHDATKYRVAQILVPMSNCAPKGDDPVPYEDHLKFFLPGRYFQSYKSSNGMRRSTCVSILCRVFMMATTESEYVMRQNPEGFWIVCRRDQFADFILARHDANECINGIKDLRPHMIPVGTIGDPYGQVSTCTGVPRDDVKRVLQAAGCATGQFKLFEDAVQQVWNRRI